MTNEEFFNMLAPAIAQAKKDNDCFVVVHFSRKSDTFQGEHTIDAGDALIVIDNLIKSCGLDYNIMAQAMKNQTLN